MEDTSWRINLWAKPEEVKEELFTEEESLNSYVLTDRFPLSRYPMRSFSMLIDMPILVNIDMPILVKALIKD